MVPHPTDRNHSRPQKLHPDGWLKYVPLLGVILGVVRLIVELFRH